MKHPKLASFARSVERGISERALEKKGGKNRKKATFVSRGENKECLLPREERLLHVFINNNSMG